MIGINKASRFNARVSLIEKTKLFIEGIKIEIEYTCSSLPLIIEKFSSQDNFDCLDFLKLCQKKLHEGVDFPCAWKNSVLQSSSLYLKDEKDKLINLGQVLGTSDLNGQLSLLSMYSNYFDEFLTEAKKQKDKYSNMSVSLGVFVGLAVFVLVLW